MIVQPEATLTYVSEPTPAAYYSQEIEQAIAVMRQLPREAHREALLLVQYLASKHTEAQPLTDRAGNRVPARAA